MNPSSCPNIVAAEFVKPTFESLATRDYVGQQQSWHYVSGILEAYAGGAPRARRSGCKGAGTWDHGVDNKANFLGASRLFGTQRPTLLNRIPKIRDMVFPKD